MREITLEGEKPQTKVACGAESGKKRTGQGDGLYIFITVGFLTK